MTPLPQLCRLHAPTSELGHNAWHAALFLGQLHSTYLPHHQRDDRHREPRHLGQVGGNGLALPTGLAGEGGPGSYRKATTADRKARLSSEQIDHRAEQSV